MAASRWAHHAWRHVALAALLWALATAKPSFPVAYCAKINTASMAASELHILCLSCGLELELADFSLLSPLDYSIFQSEGLCYQFCLNKYALSVVLNNACWCSDYVPSKASQVSTDECNNSCPGYPDDVCGGNGLFGYIALNKRPSGTATSGTVTSTTVRMPVPLS
jgi:hypothetical protein